MRGNCLNKTCLNFIIETLNQTYHSILVYRKPVQCVLCYVFSCIQLHSALKTNALHFVLFALVHFFAALHWIHSRCFRFFANTIRTNEKKDGQPTRREREKNTLSHTNWVHVGCFFSRSFSLLKIYTNTWRIIFRLFHSMSDKLYTKCKQMNWVHVDLSYCSAACISFVFYLSIAVVAVLSVCFMHFYSVDFKHK